MSDARLADSITIRLSAGQRAHLERLAAERGCTVSAEVRRLLGVALRLEAAGES